MKKYEIEKTFKTIEERDAFVEEWKAEHPNEAILMLNSTDNSIVGDGTIVLHSITTV